MKNDITQPLDPMQMVVARLNEIAQDVRQLPKLLARIEALAESTRQLEVALRDATNELRARYSEHQHAIEEMRLKQSGFESALTAFAGDLRRFQSEHEHCPVRTQIPKRITMLERQVESAMDAIARQNLRIRRLEESQVHTEMQEELDWCAAEVHEWRPWWRGLKWFVVIVGGVFVTALAVALLWTLTQSGAGLP